MKKIIFSEAAKGRAKHYTSKNNAKSYSLPLQPTARERDFRSGQKPHQPRVFPAQAASEFYRVACQHRFVKTYMEDIGHLEFGDLHRPLLFPGSESLKALDPLNPTYWLKYWLIAFTHLAQQVFGNVHFISFERLCASPDESLHRIFEVIGGHTPDLEPSIQLFKEAKEPTETDMFPGVLVAEATALRATLFKRDFHAH